LSQMLHTRPPRWLEALRELGLNRAAFVLTSPEREPSDPTRELSHATDVEVDITTHSGHDVAEKREDDINRGEDGEVTLANPTGIIVFQATPSDNHESDAGECVVKLAGLDG